MHFRNSGFLALLLWPSLLLAQPLLAPVPSYQPIDGAGRLKWFTVATVGPTSLLLSGPISAGWGTAFNSPPEYGPSWSGFGKRYGMRLTGVSTGNAMNAGLGAIWGEDPRYFRLGQRGTFGTRVKYVIKSSFYAPYRDGTWHPAYARMIGNVGNNFLSNAWRVPSENSAGDAALRSVSGVGAQLAANAFSEFWPDVWRKISGKDKKKKD